MVSMNGSKNKRKGHDDTAISMSSSRSVVFSPRHPSVNSGNWMECKGRLESIAQLCNSEKDPVFDDMATISTLRGKSFSEQLKIKLETADALFQTLEHQIAATNVHLQDESAAVAALNEQWQKLVRHADFIKQQSVAAEQQLQELSKEARKYQEIVDGEREITEMTTQQRAKQVPRLQQQLTLYGIMTGIKWDFEAQEKMNSDCLVGEVNVPSENTVRRFQIDREVCSRYQLANQLWNMMDGGRGEKGNW